MFLSEVWGARLIEAPKVPSGVGCGYCAPSPEHLSLLILEKVHFGGYMKHSGVLMLKLWFAVHRILQGCATDSVSFSPTDCSS